MSVNWIHFVRFDPKRGPGGFDEVMQAKKPGFFGWPYSRGDNKPYAKIDFAARAQYAADRGAYERQKAAHAKAKAAYEAAKAAYDKAVKEAQAKNEPLPVEPAPVAPPAFALNAPVSYTAGEAVVFDPAHPVNDSPYNTGIRDLPPTQPAFIWYPGGASARFPVVNGGGGHFRFHFQDTAAVASVKRLMQLKETAFDTINRFFNSTLPKKIDYFVWSDAKMADSIFHQRLAFSESSLCLTHTDPKHTIGHEMTHSISYHAVKTKKQTQLIAEGVCVCFDGTARDNIAAVKKNMDSRITVSDIWKNDSRLGEEIIYPLGGELVKRLIVKYGRDKFMRLLENQTYENAVKIYGNDLEKVLQQLEKDINPE